MKRYFLLISLTLTSLSKAFGQEDPGRAADSISIIKIQKTLPNLKGSTRIDSLLQLCQYYDYGYPKTGQFEFWIDSIHHLASLAKAESRTIGYRRGQALSVFVRQNIDKLSESEIEEAIQTGNEINDDFVLGWGYLALADFAQDWSTYIQYGRKSISHFRKVSGLKAAEAGSTMFQACMNHGQLESALDFGQAAIDLLEPRSDVQDFISGHHLLLQRLYSQMAELYDMAGDYQNALKYLRKNEQYGKMHWTYYRDFNFNKAEIFCSIGQADSALFYADSTRYREQWEANNEYEKAWSMSVLGRAYFLKTNYSTALKLFSNSITALQKKNYPFGTMRPLLASGETYLKTEDFPKALKFANEGLNIATKWQVRPEMMRGYQLLSSIYHRLGNIDSAYFYLLLSNQIRDSIAGKQQVFKFYDYQKSLDDAKKESRIGILNRDNQIKKQQIRQQATFRNFLIAVLIAAIFAGLYIYRNISLKRRNERIQQEHKEQEWKMQQFVSEKKQTELQKQAVELEMQALRAQMNPHFIFNCLSSINRFILKNEGKAASNYLTRFSRLIRMVLLNSQKPLIPLEEELEMLRIYLDMERLRFKESFDFIVTFTNVFDTGTVLVPPLILQPFCENALWHGLMHKAGHGHLNIDLSMENNILQCVITDDGIGRERAGELKRESAVQEKSMGLQITTQRLALLNQNENVQTSYSIEDVLDEHSSVAGTRVILKISHHQEKGAIA